MAIERREEEEEEGKAYTLDYCYALCFHFDVIIVSMNCNPVLNTDR